MAHSFANLMYHTVYSTKNRRNLLDASMMPELIKVVGGIVRDRDGKLLEMNGTANHVHLLTIFAPKFAVSDLIRDMKAVATDWVHERFPPMADFAWQTGYGCFTVSKSNADDIAKYIADQETHHLTMTFEQEYIAFLQRNEVDYDPRFVFD